MNTTPITPVATPLSIALIIRNKEARADSRQLANYLGLKHKSVFQTINDHITSFEVLGKVRFENAASTESATGQRMRFALLNEDQAYFLLTMSRNTPRVVGLKLELVKAFRDTRRALAAYQAGTLPSFKGLQDALQVVPGGPGPWLFSNINKMVNATAGVMSGTRAQCTAAHQAMLTYLQAIATQAVAGAKDSKDAYQRVKETLRPFGASAFAIAAT